MTKRFSLVVQADGWGRSTSTGRPPRRMRQECRVSVDPEAGSVWTREMPEK